MIEKSEDIDICRLTKEKLKRIGKAEDVRNIPTLAKQMTFLFLPFQVSGITLKT